MAGRVLPRKTETKGSVAVTTTSKAAKVGLEMREAIDSGERISSIPGWGYHTSYVNRVLPGGADEYVTFDFAMQNHENVLIEGPTGAGKTHAIQAWAALRRLHFYSVSSSIGIEPSQMFGKWIPSEDGGIVWQDGPVTDIVRNGGVLLFNEVNFIPERIGTVLFSLLDRRREIQLVDHHGEVIKAHDECVVLADMNPDYAGTREMNKAFRNRFAIQLTWDYDPKVEEKLVKSKALVKAAGQFRSALESGEYTTPVATNMLIEFEKHENSFGMDFAIMCFLNHFSDDERPAAQITLFSHRNEIKSDLKGETKLTPYGDPRYDPDHEGEWPTAWQYEPHPVNIEDLEDSIEG